MTLTKQKGRHAFCLWLTKHWKAVGFTISTDNPTWKGDYFLFEIRFFGFGFWYMCDFYNKKK